MVIGSPPCTRFMGHQHVARMRAEGQAHLSFMVQVYREQMKHGRHFLHEHPEDATSWETEQMQALTNMEGVSEMVADLCRYGLAVKDRAGSLYRAHGSARFVSSAPAVLRELCLRCTGDHDHIPLTCGRAASAFVYPPGLCRAILRGIVEQRRSEGEVPRVAQVSLATGVGLYALGEIESNLEVEVDASAEGTRVGDEEEVMRDTAMETADWARHAWTSTSEYWDANTGEPLPPDLARAARQEEIQFMLEWRVWDEATVAECRRRTGKGPLGGKWVDVNKGDSQNPLVRSRYVAKEIAFHRSDDFFAATPPLEARRLLLSHVASSMGEKIMVIDARKAHLHAAAERLLWSCLPRCAAQGIVLGCAARCMALAMPPRGGRRSSPPSSLPWGFSGASRRHVVSCTVPEVFVVSCTVTTSASPGAAGTWIG